MSRHCQAGKVKPAAACACLPQSALAQAAATELPDWSIWLAGALFLILILLYVALLRTQSQRLRREVGLKTRELNTREQLFRTLSDKTSAGIFMVRGESLEVVNPAMSRLTGYSEEDLLQMEFPRLVHPADRALVRRRARMRQSGDEVPGDYRFRIVTREGATRWVELSVDAVPLAGETVSVGTCIDITEHKDLQRDLALEGQFHRLIANTSADFASASQSNIDARIDRMLELFGQHLGADRAYLFRYSEDGTYEVNTHEWCAPGVAPAKQDLQHTELGSIPWLAEQQRVMLEQGQPFIVQDVQEAPDEAGNDKELLLGSGVRSLMLIPVNSNPAFTGFFGFDSLRPRSWPQQLGSQLKIVAHLLAESLASIDQEAALTRDTLTDPLTGLYNRRYLSLQAPKWLSQVHEGSGTLTLVLIDIDHFKPLNDRYGHLTGDQVLKVLGETLRAESRTQDVLVRYGGEEFLLVMHDVPAPEAISAVDRILGAIRTQQTDVDGVSMGITVSAGLVSNEEIASTDVTLDDLLEIADRRLYQAKSAGRDCLVASDPAPVAP
ncbi:MAG: diguanylate cyclase [Natronospirillum sp.]|uniref:sensor domain-containing diguanylate cyclase n=1 Tax=Natronospirillum sp. TaxID=2812955 RepID=UPI0025DE9374|nr:diguanylate cyclase [Natronospirillum sp.]MCH8550348.1 diguanylate cyclase [Natronospirillum sp.]